MFYLVVNLRHFLAISLCLFSFNLIRRLPPPRPLLHPPIPLQRRRSLPLGFYFRPYYFFFPRHISPNSFPRPTDLPTAIHSLSLSLSLRCWWTLLDQSKAPGLFRLVREVIVILLSFLPSFLCAFHFSPLSHTHTG